jgi:RNA polymerase sigma-70 factor (ECF subfamily)
MNHPTTAAVQARSPSTERHAAFEALMREHNRMMFRLARSILKDDPAAEDAVQDAYLSAFRNFDSFRGDAAMSTWLARIVINEAYGRLRRNKRDAKVIDFDTQQPDHSFAGPSSEGRSPDETAMIDDTGAGGSVEQPDTAALRSEVRGLLERRIDALPEQFRTAFMLREVEELSVEETAAILDIPPETVRSRTFRARAMLRESLARDIDAATLDAFSFDGDRCDRMCAGVLKRLDQQAGDNAAPPPTPTTQQGDPA